MAANPKHPPGPPMNLANMRRQSVRSLIAYCLNDSCRHQAVIDVSSYPGDTPMPWFRSKVKCAKCGARNSRIDVRPNWKEAPGSVDDWSANLHGEPDVSSALAKLAARREALRMEGRSYHDDHGDGGQQVRRFCAGSPYWLRRQRRPSTVAGIVCSLTGMHPTCRPGRS